MNASNRYIARKFFGCYWRAGLSLAVMALAATATAQLLDRAQPIVRRVASIERSEPPGAPARITYMVSSRRDCPGTVKRVVEDAQGYVHAQRERPVLPYPPRDAPYPVTIDVAPPQGACGRMTLHARVLYRCHWVQALWPIEIDAAPVSFDVACPR